MSGPHPGEGQYGPSLYDAWRADRDAAEAAGVTPPSWAEWLRDLNDHPARARRAD